jgi:CRP-like cAMP-binding protein
MKRSNNKILQAIEQSGSSALQDILEAVELPAGSILCEHDSLPEWIYFLESGIASISWRSSSGQQDIALFGREGFGCFDAILSGSSSPYCTSMKIEGEASKVKTMDLQKLIRSDPAVSTELLKYTIDLINQIAQNGIANTRYNTEQRLARWLLMVHERLEDNTIRTTHQQVATALGVGRVGITLALANLQRDRLVSAMTGKIIVDGPRLRSFLAALP